MALVDEKLDDSAPHSSRSGHELSGRILEVAAQLFAEHGYNATSMRQVAEAAGCTKPALYYHFANKAALFLEIIHASTMGIARLVEQQLAQPGTVRQRMSRAMRAYFEHVEAQPVAIRVMLRAEIHAESGQPAYDFQSARQMFTEMVMNLLREGVESGEIRHDVNLEDAMMVLAGVVDLRGMLCVLQGQCIPKDFPERVLALMFGGIGR